MRQLIVLVVGLVLIAAWGIGLRFALTSPSAEKAPELLPHLRAQHIGKSNSTEQFSEDRSRVIPASFSTFSPEYPVLSEVIDNNGKPWKWVGPILRRSDSVVWLRGNEATLKYQFKAGTDVDTTVEVKFNGELVGTARFTRRAEVITCVLDLGNAKLPKNDLRVVLECEGNNFTVQIHPTGSQGIRIRKPSTDSLQSPTIVDTRLSDHYPWVPVSTTTIPLTILMDHPSTVGAHIRAYHRTRQLIGIMFGVKSDTVEVLETTLSQVTSTESLQTLKLTVDNKKYSGFDSFELRYASVEEGHVFLETPITVTPTKGALDDVIATSVSTISSDFTAPKYYTSNQNSKPKIFAKVTPPRRGAENLVACKLFRNNQVISESLTLASADLQFGEAKLVEGVNVVEARLFVGDEVLSQTQSTTKEIEVKTGGFRIASAGPDSFGSALGVSEIQVTFSRPVQGTLTGANFRLQYSENGQFGGGAKVEEINTTPTLDDKGSRTLVRIQPGAAPKKGYYQLTVLPDGIKDFYGNDLETPDGELRGIYVKTLGGAAQLAADAYPVTPGVNRGNAKMVEFPEFVQPRKVPTGFNPNDKVETRVGRLYFFRDAHRVAQILNRRVQSYNRQEVAVRRQLADKSRQEADSRTTNRQIAERSAVQAAQKTRELENQLSDTQRSLNATLQQLQTAAGQQIPPDNQARLQQQQQVIDQLQTTARSFAQQAATLESQVRSARDAEVAANERWQQNQREEDLARTDQFRLETAAAHADPDTFAEGNPDSQDPVAQVSISVIGEGLLHLRGPLKGVNQVRMMIDQIDSPQGQVRVNVHSTQINGDEADELEVVANRIQTYIDQARFLTVQSAEMLRKAVIHVASSRAEEARGLYPGASQAERDQLYLHAFFGVDFVNELRSMDSELLHTGNKLLSLHSMDVTSLSSALMLLALANNGTRLAILEEFQRLVQCDLATAEQQYIQNGIGSCVNGCKKGCKHHQNGPPICQLAGNSSFTSLKGFFDSQLQNNDTMSPLQREAIGLAQILKARLITEMEYKQRVMERAVIEERTQNVENSEAQFIRERSAEDEVRKAREAQVRARGIILPSITKSIAVVDEVQTVLSVADAAMQGVAKFLNENKIAAVPANGSQSATEATLREVYARLSDTGAKREEAAKRRNVNSPFVQDHKNLGSSRPLFYLEDQIAHQDLVDEEKKLGVDTNYFVYTGLEERRQIAFELNQLSTALKQVQSVISAFHGPQSVVMIKLDTLIFGVDRLLTRKGAYPILQGPQKEDLYAIASIYEIRSAIELLLYLYSQSEALRQKSTAIGEAREAFQIAFTRFGSTNKSESQLEAASEVFRAWAKFAANGSRLFDAQSDASAKQAAESQLLASTRALEDWLEAVSKLDAAQSLAQDARRPLDHKKFLDMLIDELEEKYIELLEGTRAHTANIDNYLKRLTTSLDDDFNTQYYYPVFRLVREASQYKRVEFGQTETTNILVNNREFGKVSPSATMEFDLPKRDILIEEGIDSAMAIYNDVGALVNDPNLLALAKMKSGGSTASPGAGTTGGMGAIRNVLPGLQSDSSEQLMAQNAGSGPKFESNVEKLIPDPAIYKFETGTGYEIRPVIAPDGQAVVFDFHYLYSTQIREPVRADEKHLGRVKQHFIDTDVQLSNFELREVSRYVVALKAERTANGVPLLEDIPVIGALWRPLPNREKSLQQNIIMAQATIFPTLFDLMGLRWAPAVSDLDPLNLSNREFLVRGRNKFLENRIYDYSSARVDDFLRIPEDARRADYYRSQETLPTVHPNGYRGRGLDYQNSQMREGYNPEEAHVTPGYVPAQSPEGSMYLPNQQHNPYEQMPQGAMTMEVPRKMELAPPSRNPGVAPPQTPPNRVPTPPTLNDSSSSRRADGWQYQRAN